MIVSYTPRNGSYTKVLKEEFLRLAKDKTTIKELDLVASPPDLLLADNLELLMQWNAGKRDFTKEEEEVFGNHPKIMELFLEANYIVLATPVYNFSVPAAVKAWVDAIVVSDKTFAFDPAKGFSGLCGDKKALTLMVAGFAYNQTSLSKEYATTTINENFGFMGVSVEHVSAFGVDQNREELDEILDRAKGELSTVIENWY